MKILIDMGHPAHVHLFRNFISEMQNRGHEFLVTARKKDVTHTLLKNYQIEYVPVGSLKKGTSGLIIEWIQRDLSIYSLAKQFDPDLLMGMGNPCVCHAAKLLGKYAIIFTDTEHAKLQNSLSVPFCDAVCTPSCYVGDLGKKQVRYNSYHELAYLHPNNFTPNPTVLTELNLKEGDPFIVIRFVSWQANHDVGQSGITLDNKRKAIHEFEKYGRVFITSEKPLPQEFEKYRISVAPEKMHDLLYYATLLYGESSTMASECAVLGTHAIFCDFAGRGYTDEEEKIYDLIYNFKLDELGQEESIKKAVELLQDPDLKKTGREKQEHLLSDKIDATAFMVWFIENYPDSVAKMEKNDISRSFK